jgi:hypothetical protein
MVARIYRPAKSATQSGAAGTTRWLLEFEPESPREIEPLMGWTSSSDMKQQVKLWFPSKAAAVAYAERNALDYRVEEPKPAARRVMSYSDNFKPSRPDLWTH